MQEAKFLYKIPIIKEEPIVLEELAETPIPTQVNEMGWESWLGNLDI